MCGICGVYSVQSGEPVSQTLIEHMTHLLFHRGPDDSGIYLDGTLGLGSARLSIIDLSGGHQPMSNETEDVWLICNGEIWSRAARTGAPASANTEFNPTERSRVLLPDMFEPLAMISCVFLASSRMSHRTQVWGSSNGWPRASA